jgi:hypothetical protein
MQSAIITYKINKLTQYSTFWKDQSEWGAIVTRSATPPLPSNATWWLDGSTMLLSVPSRPHILRSITTQLHWSNTEPRRMAKVPEPVTLYCIRLRVCARHSASAARTRSCSGQEGLGPKNVQLLRTTIVAVVPEIPSLGCLCLKSC